MCLYGFMKNVDKEADCCANEPQTKLPVTTTRNYNINKDHNKIIDNTQAHVGRVYGGSSRTG